MNPATHLAALVGAGRTDEALSLCEQHCADEITGAYYAFWRDRLRGTRPAAGPLPQHAAAPGLASIGDALLEDFVAHPYRIEAAPMPAAPELAAERDRLVAASPFKGDIYQPTAKVALADQVRGLHRVRELTAPANLQASAGRFEALRRRVRELGIRRAFVLGNGPSLKRTDLSMLEGELTIGFNGIFLHDSFKPTIYVVEDHLVAEDRVREIHAYACPVKVFPSYLGYCIEPQDNTIFLNHRSRISYPVDTDFSADAGRLSYTGGTVTYTGLQIAASLGVEQIVLIGVDASYEVKDVERSETYGTGVLTSKHDDTNHFDPRYFGKGFRWHDPNVHTMLQAYRKAREHARDEGLTIVNATVGGQLEVFPRADYLSLFPLDRAHPRVAVLDFTSVQRLSATGVVKKNLLAGWPGARQLHVFSDEGARLVAFQNVPNDLYAAGSDDDSVWPAWRSLVEFDPQVLYLRPTHDRVPMTVLQVVAAAALDRPFVVHYMDDWLRKARSVRTPEVAAAYEELMRWLFDGAEQVLSICTKMSAHLVREFGLPPDRVQAVHNMLPASMARPRRAEAAPRTMRYFGGLEPDMGLATLIEVARQLERYNASHPAEAVRFEIVTAAHAIRKHMPAFEGLRSTSLRPQFDDYDDYLAALGATDLNLVCYNFDERSLDYVRLSLANKLPELLACGVPFLAIGHGAIGTMELLESSAYPLTLTEPDFRIDDMLAQALSPTPAQAQARHEAVARLLEEFSDANNRLRFQAALRRSAAMAPVTPPLPLAALRTLMSSVEKSLKHSRDLDLLLRLPLLPPEVRRPALARIRAHGRTWSVRDEQAALQRELRDDAALPDGGAALQMRAVAFLVASLGHERYGAVNDRTRHWLRTSFAPTT